MCDIYIYMCVCVCALSLSLSLSPALSIVWHCMKDVQMPSYHCCCCCGGTWGLHFVIFFGPCTSGCKIQRSRAKTTTRSRSCKKYEKKQERYREILKPTSIVINQLGWQSFSSWSHSRFTMFHPSWSHQTLTILTAPHHPRHPRPWLGSYPFFRQPLGGFTAPGMGRLWRKNGEWWPGRLLAVFDVLAARVYQHLSVHMHRHLA